jgi:hypothetical protein
MKYIKKVTITTILISLIISATPNTAHADVKSNAEQPKVMNVSFKVSSSNQHIYTISSKYNPELGCTTLISLGDKKTPINRHEDGFLCNANKESDFITQEPDLTKFHEEMLAQREKISTSRIVKMSQVKTKFKKDPPPIYTTQIEVNEYTVGVASCNEQQNCIFNSMPAFEILKKQGDLELPSTPLVKGLGNSQITFSKFTDGVNLLPNFISEVNTINFYNDNNTLLYEVKPRTSPLYMSNFYSTKVPYTTSKVQICTTYEYCFTTRLADSIASYLQYQNPARSFALNINNNNLAKYHKVGLTVQNGNFANSNFEKTLTLKYTLNESGNDTVKALRIGTNHQDLQGNNKINKDYLNPEICDDSTCLPATILPSSNCPNNPTICLTATFTPIKKKIMYAQLIYPDGTPASYGTIQFPSNSDAMVSRMFDTTKSEESWLTYSKLPEFYKLQSYFADEDGVISFTLDLDHFFNKPIRCNMRMICSTDYGYIFSRNSFLTATKENPLLITVPADPWLNYNKSKALKPGMKITGQVLATANNNSRSTQPPDNPVEYLATGAYLQTYDSKGDVTMKYKISTTGKFSLTLPSTFTRLEVCSAKNLCHSETNYNKYYYLFLDESEVSSLPLLTLPTPNDKVGLLRGILYNKETNKILAKRKVYLFNDQNELVGSLPTNAKGEFIKNLNYILYNKVTRIQGCSKFNKCDYNEIRLDEVQTYIDEQINYPFQIISSSDDLFMSIAKWYVKATVFALIIGSFVL